MLKWTLAAGVAAVVALRLMPSCYTAKCREPFAWRWRRFDDGRRHALCAKCARHVDRIRAARRRAVHVATIDIQRSSL